MNYSGKTCPYCRAELKENDHVIVCDSCGIPHHQECWNENKGCTTFGCLRHHYEPQGTNISDVCSNCGGPLGEGQEFCPKCGTKRETLKSVFCVKCGAELQKGQRFCYKCGQNVDLPVDRSATAKIEQFNAAVVNKKKKSPVPLIAGAAAIVIIVIILLTGSSGPNLKKIYSDLCDPAWAAVASDGSYLAIDTNPFDIEEQTDFDALDAISLINAKFGFPESVYQRMLETRSMDGRQTQTLNDITASWTYHPDSGLEVMYEKN